jgi:DNA-binding GntR family transcriptional regulator
VANCRGGTRDEQEDLHIPTRFDLAQLNPVVRIERIRYSNDHTGAVCELFRGLAHLVASACYGESTFMSE